MLRRKTLKSCEFSDSLFLFFHFDVFASLVLFCCSVYALFNRQIFCLHILHLRFFQRIASICVQFMAYVAVFYLSVEFKKYLSIFWGTVAGTRFMLLMTMTLHFFLRRFDIVSFMNMNRVISTST